MDRREKYSVFLNIVAWSAMWGIFEATVGYVLHALSFGFGWLVWYPAACFFMAGVYRKTRWAPAIFLTGLLSASIKMLNLFLPGSIDRVINPAVSIIFEALAMAAVITAANHLFEQRGKNMLAKAASALSMNTGWRLMYMLYAFLLMPGWMRDISVISSMEKFTPFFITENLSTSALLFGGYHFKEYLFKPLGTMERFLSVRLHRLPGRKALTMQTGLAVLALGLNIVLQLYLR